MKINYRLLQLKGLDFLVIIILKIVVKLYQDNIIQDGPQKFVVYKNLDEKYLEKLDSMDTYASGKKIFKFSTRFTSTILPNDSKVSNFMRMVSCLLEKETATKPLTGRSNSKYLPSYFQSMLVPKTTQMMEKIAQADFKKIQPYIPQLLNLQIFIMTNMKVPSSPKDKEPEKSLASSFKIFLNLARFLSN
jgi:hypothetical protein